MHASVVVGRVCGLAKKRGTEEERAARKSEQQGRASNEEERAAKCSSVGANDTKGQSGRLQSEDMRRRRQAQQSDMLQYKSSSPQD